MHPARHETSQPRPGETPATASERFAAGPFSRASRRRAPARPLPRGPSRLSRLLHWSAAAALVAAAMLVALSGALAPVYTAILALAAGLMLGLAIRLTLGVGRRGRMQIRRLHDRVEAQSDQIWQLEEIVAHYRSVVDTLGDVVIRRDAAGVVVFVNECYERVFAMPRLAAIGRPLAIPALGFDGATEEDRNVALETVEGRRWFARFDDVIRFDGLDRPLFQTVLRDVTREREAEQALIRTRDAAEAANDAKSRFLASVSHEIRTPLNGILGMTGLLQDTSLTGEQTTYTRAVAASGKALLSLIDDVLDFSKIEAGRLDLHPSPLALEEMIEDLGELLAPRAQAKGLEIAVYVSPSVPARIQVDGERLRQVLLNLLGNAIKFTERGGVSLTCQARQRGDGMVDIDLAVADTGIGIARPDADRIFGEFEQAEHGPSRRFGGSGLGLAISRRIVRRMGGDIAVASARGEGAEFSFCIAAPVVDLGDAPSAPFAGCRVALVSRSAIEAENLQRRLADAGAEIVRADTADGIAGAVDAALVDGHSPSWAIEQLHALRARLGHRVPAAVLIAPSERSELDTLRANGFHSYLVKPVRRASLLQVTAWLTGRGEAEAEPAAADIDPGGVPRPASRPLSVLLVEDNPINALLARALLEKMGHSVEHVEDGAAAIAAVTEDATGAARRFDCMLTDLHMPGVDGREAIREIRRREAASDDPRLPIIALTADMMPETRARTLELGADALVTKPVEGPRLQAVLDEAVPSVRAAPGAATASGS